MTLTPDDDVEASAAARIASPALLLAVSVAATAIVAYQAWWTLGFVVFAVAIALLARRRVRWREVIKIALAIGGSVALSALGLSLVSVSAFADAIACTPDPCPSVGRALLVAGTAALIAAAFGLTACVWYIRRPGKAQLVLPALNVLLVGLLGAALIFGAQWGNALVEIAGLTAASAVLPVGSDRPRLLRAAVFAQAADLGTFGFVWQLGAGEQNPIGRWTMEALLALGSADASWSWEAATATGATLILAKLALIGLLIGVTPHLGRYRRTVLLAATVAGSVGAGANVVVLLP